MPPTARDEQVLPSKNGREGGTKGFVMSWREGSQVKQATGGGGEAARRPTLMIMSSALPSPLSLFSNALLGRRTQKRQQTDDRRGPRTDGLGRTRIRWPYTAMDGMHLLLPGSLTQPVQRVPCYYSLPSGLNGGVPKSRPEGLKHFLSSPKSYSAEPSIIAGGWSGNKNCR